MRYNKNRLKDIEHSIGFYKDLYELYLDRLEKLKMIFSPSGYSTGISYNDFDNDQCSKKEESIFKIAKDIEDTEHKIQETRETIIIFRMKRR